MVRPARAGPRRSCMRTLIWLAAMLMLTPFLLIAFQDGPLPALTGGFGEPTCLVCHFDNPLNEPLGSVQLRGIPKSYTPGRRYAIEIAVRRPALQRGGFELSSRFAEGSRAGQQAGLLGPVDPRSQIVPSVDRRLQYLHHTKSGAETATPGEARWTVQWTAPAKPAGAVAFHLSANASNSDASPLGDFIYTSYARSAAPK